MGAAGTLLEETGIPANLPTGKRDPGILQFDAGDIEAAVPAFVDAIAKHRHFERETDPPMI